MKRIALILVAFICFSAMKSTAQTTKTPQTDSPFSIADSAAYTGKYKYEGLPFDYMVVSVREGQLYFVGGEYKGFLIPQKNKKDVFDVNGVATFTFVRNDQMQVSELVVDYDGEKYQGQKEGK